MREIRTEIQISAPIDKVWQVLTDFDQWTDWNPTVKHASGSASVGSKLDITIDGGGSRDAKYQPTVLEADPPKSFRWSATMMASFVFRNDRIFELRERDGGTELVHTEQFSGFMVAMMWGKLSSFVQPHLERTNKALKEKVEASP